MKHRFLVITPLTLLACAVTDDDQLDVASQPIKGGTIDYGTPATDATVSIVGGGKACTATLVAPDLVLTAAHCFSRVTATNAPDFCTQTENPTTWYPLDPTTYPDGMSVRFGYDVAGLYANRNAVGAWEKFTISNGATGGHVRHLHDISLKSMSNHFVSVQGDIEGWVGVHRSAIGVSETFTLERVAGPGIVMSGDQVALRTSPSPKAKYVVAENGGGSVLNADRVARGPWETFVIRNEHNYGPISAGLKVSLQASNGQFVVAEHGGGGFAHFARARSYSIPNGADMALLRLETPVSAAIATPAQVLTRPPLEALANPPAFWAAQTVRMAGWGGTLPMVPTLAGRYRQTANGTNIQYPCPGGRPDGICLTSSVNIDSGDSGGPMYWTSSAGITQQIGVTAGNFGGEPPTTLFSPTSQAGGYSCSDLNPTKPYPNISVWLETMLGMTKECTPIDPFAAIAEPDGTTFRVRNPSTGAVLERGFGSLADANRAIQTMRHYGMDRKCFVHDALEYNLADGEAPQGMPRADEDCSAISNLTTSQLGSSWVLLSNGFPVQLLGTSETHARIALGTLLRYDVRHICFVTRPGPIAWTYFRR